MSLFDLFRSKAPNDDGLKRRLVRSGSECDAAVEGPDGAFRNAVRQEFAPIASQCGASLMELEPFLFGFCTEYAVLTVGAYPGHFRGICVKLRRRENREPVSVKDDIDIGLANFEASVRRDVESKIYTRRQRWTAAEIRKEVASLAEVTRSVAMPFLTDPHADWAGVREFVDRKIERAMRERSGNTAQ